MSNRDDIGSISRRIMSNWADLPKEILHLILSNLFTAKDRHGFSLVCQSWNTAVASDSPYHHSPCIIFYKPILRQWKLSQHNGFYSMKSSDPQLQLLHGAYIRCSKYGWLLMSREDRDLFFFNPFDENQNIHHLPRSDYTYKTVCFFNEPTSRDCIVIGIDNPIYGACLEVRVGVLNHETDEWKSYLFHHNVHYKLPLCSPILHGGLLYTLDTRGRLSSFDTNELDNKSSWIVKTTQSSIMEHDGLPIKTKHQYLIKLKGEDVLLSVLVGGDSREVNVYKLDMTKWPESEEWEPVRDLPDKALFLSYNACFSLVVSPPSPLAWMVNKVFFPKLHDDCVGVFYSLDTNKYHSYEGNYASDGPYGIKDLDQFGTWIVPQPTKRFIGEWKWHPGHV